MASVGVSYCFLRIGAGREKGKNSMTVDEILQKIVKICRQYDTREVFLFGSRAKGTQRERSDIDIAVSGTEDFSVLEEEIMAISTLYKIDLVNIDECENSLLLEDIEKYGRKIL